MLGSIFFDVGCRKYSDRSTKLAQPPAVFLLVVDVDDVTGSDAQLVVHVGGVVVQGPAGANAWSIPTGRSGRTISCFSLKLFNLAPGYWRARLELAIKSSLSSTLKYELNPRKWPNKYIN